MLTLILALRVLVSVTANPVFVDACDGDLCSILDADNMVRVVPRTALPACAREGVWSYVGQCTDERPAVYTHCESVGPRLDGTYVTLCDGNVTSVDDGRVAHYLPFGAPKHVALSRASDDGSDIKL